MATLPIKYKFKATKYFSTTTHYSLVTETNKPLISKRIKIADDRGFAKSKPIFWCSEHNGKKWIKPNLTGLFKTDKENVYFGCRGNRKDLILFDLKDKETLIVYYYNDFYTRDLKPILNNL